MFEKYFIAHTSLVYCIFVSIMASKRCLARKTRLQTKKEQTLYAKCESLHDAISTRNLAKVAECLEIGAVPTYISINNGNLGFNSFHLSIPNLLTKKEETESKINIKILNLLINFNDNDNDIFSCDNYYNMNPFEWSLINGMILTTKWFLDFIEKINKRNNIKANEIINRKNTLPTTKYSLSSIRGFEDIKHIKNETPIHLAIKSKNVDCVKLLCQFIIKPDVGCVSIHGLNAILLSIKMNQPQILLEIVNIAKMRDLETVKYEKMNCLEYAKFVYNNYLTQPCHPSDITKSWQCLQIIKARLYVFHFIFPFFFFPFFGNKPITKK